MKINATIESRYGVTRNGHDYYIDNVVVVFPQNGGHPFIYGERSGRDIKRWFNTPLDAQEYIVACCKVELDRRITLMNEAEKRLDNENAKLLKLSK